jgi:hypothetical protein
MTRIQPLFKAAKDAASERMWGAGVELARKGAVAGVSDDGDEVHLKVKTSARALPFEVYLWPDDVDWGCDCGRSEVCVHVVAATLAVKRGKGDLPKPQKAYRVRLRYQLSSEGTQLTVSRRIVFPDGHDEPLRGSLAEAKVIVGRADAAAEQLLAVQPRGPLSADAVRRLLWALEGDADATLDGDTVGLSVEPVLFRVRVKDQGADFLVGLFRPAGIDKLFRGAVLLDGTLHPTSHGELTADQRKMLVKGVTFSASEVGTLVGEYLPALRKKAPVDIATKRLPAADALAPRVRVTIKERQRGLEVLPELVYGDPPLAVVTQSGGLRRLTDSVIAARDLAAERVASRRFQERIGRQVGFRFVLSPQDAATFLRDQLPRHDGPVHGRVDPERFRIVPSALAPSIEVRQATGGDGRPAWSLDVAFDGEGGSADPMEVLTAYRSRSALVPLMDGGWAPLPLDWLEKHGPLLRELLEARDREGRVDRNATAALVELLEDTASDVPPDLSRLRSFLEGEEELPEEPLPEGLVADLRPYQRAGLQWLSFLRKMDLHGILADDMGLGKTLQALGAMLATDGQHLVVAPTSVIRNWEIEANRFTPTLSVNVYHGAGRTLNDARITLTSYALLRLDLQLLRERRWSIVVLDEAQAIKNPSSQTAMAARAVRAEHRLALTGTPVENRLEELWSLFRFLMPGLLGSLESFRERFVRPIEAGDGEARRALRARVRPYILRRLKKHVASELPPLTEMVVRCTLGEAQRRVYEGVQLAARRDVAEALDSTGRGRSTMQILEALLRMRQAACDPTLLPGGGDGAGSAKLDRMEELLMELVLEGHKALVFSQWTSLLDRAQARLKDLGIATVRLDGSTRDRAGVIETFQDEAGPPVFLLSLKAGGTGLNLTAADYVMHLDPWWNPAVERQATDRAHRIGQTKAVVSLRLIAEATVEERILALQDAKRDLVDAALGAEGGFLGKLTADELRALFD